MILSLCSVFTFLKWVTVFVSQREGGELFCFLVPQCENEWQSPLLYCSFLTEIWHLLIWRHNTPGCLVSFRYISVQLNCFESQLVFLFLIKQPYAFELNSLSCYIKFVDDSIPYRTQLPHIPPPHTQSALLEWNRWASSAAPSCFLDL